MARRASARRNILLVLLLLVIAGGLIVSIPAIRKTTPIVPAESPEAIAKRAAPENAYFTLKEAADLLPQRPGADTPVQPRRRGPVPGLPGNAFGVDLPNDDAELARYLRQCEPAIAKTREALAKPYYLLPLDWSSFAHWAQSRGRDAYDSRFNRLAAALTGSAVLLARTGGDRVEAFRCLFDAVRLGQWLASDGASSMEMAVAAQGQALTWTAKLAQGADDEALRSALDRLIALRENLQPPVANLELYFRMIDNARDLGFTRDMHGPPWFVGEVFFTIRKREVVRRVIKVRDDLLQAVALPYPKYMEWRQQHQDREDMRGPRGRNRDVRVSVEFNQRREEFHGLQERHWPFESPLFAADRLMRWHAESQTWHASAEVVIALERYRLSHKEYPETLDALAPQYVAAAPDDPFNGEPFRYRRVETDYRLYSVGPNQQDEQSAAPPEDARTQRPQDDVIIHVPPTPPK